MRRVAAAIRLTNDLPSPYFADAVDTDAIIPAQMMGCSPADMVKHGGRADMGEDEFLGLKAFAYVRPEFSSLVAAGQTVVVAGAGFGCGSSREEAVRALKASGVQAVIAKSFAFIYARNQPNMHLLGVLVADEGFYERAVEGAEVEVNVPARTVSVAGQTYPFTLTTMEERFLLAGGVEKLYKTFRAWGSAKSARALAAVLSRRPPFARLPYPPPPLSAGKDLFKALVKGPAKLLGGGSGGGCGGDDCGQPAAPAAEGKLAW